MKYQISGKQIDIGDALSTHVKQELGSVVEKYAQRPTDAQVVFSKTAHEYVCEAVVHLSTGLTAQASARATEIYAASLLVVDPEAPAEKGYLAMLAARLGLDPGLVAHLHARAEALG